MLTNRSNSPLFYPFTSRISSHAEVVQARSLGWLRLFGLVRDGALLTGLSEVGHLVARTYPDAELEMLQIASDWTTLFFLWDDLVEQVQDHNEVTENNYRLIGALKGYSFREQHPVYDALRDINRRLEAAVTSAKLPILWRQTFDNRVERWLGSHVWEAKNRERQVIPSPETYIHMRQLTIGMFFEFTLAELLGGYSLTQEARESPGIQKLERLASNLIAWSNDILTLKKELAAGEIHNLILSIRNTRPMAMSAACTIAINMHNAEVNEFVQVRDSLTDCPVWSLEVAQYISALQHWVAGHLQWGIDSKRYNVAALSDQLTHEAETVRP